MMENADIMDKTSTASKREVSFDTSLLEGYVYKEPQGLHRMFEVIATITATLDFYWLRDMANPFSLFLLITKMPEAHWQAIAQCVYLPGKGGLCLADVNAESLTLMQVVEVIRVFCEGIESTPLPAMYAHFLGQDGISLSSVANLYTDMLRAQLMSQNGASEEQLNSIGLGGVLNLALAATRGKES
jgi:hypothetical protein